MHQSEAIEQPRNALKRMRDKLNVTVEYHASRLTPETGQFPMCLLLRQQRIVVRFLTRRGKVVRIFGRKTRLDVK